MAEKTKLELRLQALHDARAIHEKAASEKRAMSAEEDANYKRYLDDFHKYDAEIKRDAELESFDRALDKVQGKEERDERKPEVDEKRSEEAQRRAVRAFIQGDSVTLNDPEIRTYVKDSNIGGGYWLVPEVLTNEFIKEVDDIVFMRQKARKFRLGAGHSITAPKRDTKMSDADWTAELEVSPAESTNIGKRALTPHPLSKQTKISKDLIAYGVGVESFAMQELARANAEAEENAFMTGDGAQKPLGVFVASDCGISTDRDVSSGNTTTQIKGDGLINAKGKLKKQYLNKAQWIMHRDQITAISKLKDGDGGYLLMPSGLYGNNTDKLLGIELVSSEFAPSTIATGEYAGILGDFNNYWIADAGQVSMQRLVELYAATNEIGLLSRRHLDGMPVLEEAFVRVKFA
jgi:HK97 family phage major capsid protein